MEAIGFGTLMQGSKNVRVVKDDSQASRLSGWWIMVLFTRRENSSEELSLLEVVKNSALAMLSFRGLLNTHERCK